MRRSFSIIIICKNEERVIARCVGAIQEDMRESDELIVVDTGSTDNTLSILANYGTIKKFHFDWNDSFSDARNFGISQASKEWIFFIDSDETLVKGSLDKLQEAINNVLKYCKEDESVVFSPKIINSDDNVLYNAGRILPNNHTVRFEGIVHEYPVVVNERLSLTTIRIPDVKVNHDGYEEDVKKDKNKVIRNTTLLKKILEQNPNSARNYYFYYRDARPILTDQEYEQGLVDFFEKFPNDPFSNQIATDLALYYLNNNNLIEAEKYIGMLFESAENGVIENRYRAIYLTGFAEFQKIRNQQTELLELLNYSRNNSLNIKESCFEKGYAFDDLIGLLFFQLEDYRTAFEIADNLKTNGFSCNLTRIVDKIDKICAQRDETRLNNSIG